MREKFNGRFFKNTALLVGSTTLVQGLAVLCAPVLTRLYTPEDFGILTIYTSLASLLLVIASLRYQLAIPLPKSETDSIHLIYVSFLCLFLVTGSVIVAVFLLSGFISEALGVPGLKNFLWLLPLSLFGAGTYQVLNYWALRYSEFKLLASTKVRQGLTQIFIQITVGFFYPGPFGLLLGDSFGRAAGSQKILAAFQKSAGRSLEPPSLSKMWIVAKKYWRFPIYSSMSGLMNNSGLQVPAFLISWFYGATVLGWFSLGQRIIALPLILLGTAVSQVYFSEASQILKSEKGTSNLKEMFLKTAKKLFIISVLPLSLIAFAGPSVFEMIFGKGWQEAGQYMQALFPMFVAQFTVSPLSQTLNILERQNWQMCWDACRLITVLLAFYVSSSLSLNAYSCITLYSLSMTFLYVCLFFLNLAAFKDFRILES